MAKKKKQGSNAVGWIILAVIALGVFHATTLSQPESAARVAQPSRSVSAPAATPANPAPLTAPRFVAVASLNVRHAPSLSAPLIGALPRGTPLRILDRRNGWLLVDLNPTLEGWVTESLTTTKTPEARYLPPASL